MKLDIRLTHAQARTLLQTEHAMEYPVSILGNSTRAHCACGWRSEWVAAGFVAQRAAERHLHAKVDYPLSERRRFAIARQRHGWLLIDRATGTRCSRETFEEVIARLDEWLVDERHGMEPTA